jgi:hypothetical protein
MLSTNTTVPQSQSAGRHRGPGVDTRIAGRSSRGSVARATVLVEPQRLDVRVERPASAAHADATAANAAAALGHAPRVSFDDGLREVAEWLADRTAEDEVSDASRELEARGLTMGGGTA